MPEPVSAIAGPTDASAHLIEKIHKYSSSLKDAPKYAIDLGAEVRAVSGILGMNRDHLRRKNAKGNAPQRNPVLFFAANGCN